MDIKTLKTDCKQHGVTVAMLTDRTGFPFESIRSWFHGTRKIPAVKHVSLIAAYEMLKDKPRKEKLDKHLELNISAPFKVEIKKAAAFAGITQAAFIRTAITQHIQYVYGGSLV